MDTIPFWAGSDWTLELRGRPKSLSQSLGVAEPRLVWRWDPAIETPEIQPPELPQSSSPSLRLHYAHLKSHRSSIWGLFKGLCIIHEFSPWPSHPYAI